MGIFTFDLENPIDVFYEESMEDEIYIKLENFIVRVGE